MCRYPLSSSDVIANTTYFAITLLHLYTYYTYYTYYTITLITLLRFYTTTLLRYYAITLLHYYTCAIVPLECLWVECTWCSKCPDTLHWTVGQWLRPFVQYKNWNCKLLSQPGWPRLGLCIVYYVHPNTYVHSNTIVQSFYLYFIFIFSTTGSSPYRYFVIIFFFSNVYAPCGIVSNFVIHWPVLCNNDK